MSSSDLVCKRYLKGQALADGHNYQAAIASLRTGLSLAVREGSVFWEAELFFTLLHMEQYVCRWDHHLRRQIGECKMESATALASCPRHSSLS